MLIQNNLGEAAAHCLVSKKINLHITIASIKLATMGKETQPYTSPE